MSSMNIPAHEIEWNVSPLTMAPTKTLPQVTCPWQGYSACRECGLYGDCFPLEAQHGTP
jgi:hypothetical protein